MSLPTAHESVAGQSLLAPAGTHPLDRLLRPDWPVTIADGTTRARPGSSSVDCLSGTERASGWTPDEVFACSSDRAMEPALAGGDVVATFTRENGARLNAVVDPSTSNVVVPFSLADAYSSLVSEAWREVGTQRGLSDTQLRAYYALKRLIPRGVQLTARRALIRRQGVPDVPDLADRHKRLASARLLRRLLASCGGTRSSGSFRWFWPDDHHAAVILTHDVEGEEGIRLALELADLEEERGFRSSFNFGAWYDIDPGILRELRDRGFEVGMHGLTHDRQLFASREAFDERLPGLAALARNSSAPSGFRSPATHRVFEWLADLPIEYDCTIPNSDPYEPLPGGCCSVWPFFIGPVVELPYTLPQDHTLLTLLGHRSPALWLQQAEKIEESYGLIQCVSHPDPGYLGDADKRSVYAEFLEGMAERPRVWRALPREVAGLVAGARHVGSGAPVAAASGRPRWTERGRRSARRRSGATLDPVSPRVQDPAEMVRATFVVETGGRASELAPVGALPRSRAISGTDAGAAPCRRARSIGTQRTDRGDRTRSRARWHRTPTPCSS